MTYPAREINGAMITDDLLTPSQNHTFFYPDNLFEKINMKKEDYPIVMPDFEDDLHHFLQTAQEGASKRKDTASSWRLSLK